MGAQQRGHARGGRVAPLFSHARSYVNLHFDRSIMWHGILAWHELANGPADEKARLLADPSWRARARAEWDACTYTLAPIRTPERFILDHSERELPGQTGMTLVDYAEQRTSSPDALATCFSTTASHRRCHREWPLDERACALSATVDRHRASDPCTYPDSVVRQLDLRLHLLLRDAGLCHEKHSFRDGKHAAFFRSQRSWPSPSCKRWTSRVCARGDRPGRDVAR